MIALVAGTLASREGDTLVVLTDGGVGYEVTVPLGAMERLPVTGARVTLHTELVVREDGWALYGFDRPTDRVVFQRLLGASGFGPRLALALLSSLGAERTVQAVRRNDLAALSSVSGIGRKKAERLVLELRDRFEEVAATVPVAAAVTGPGEDAVQALVTLGYAPAQADGVVRELLAGGTVETAALIRHALQRLARVP
ncbi:MAG TPA: Holliday junction branch migration protein RuvA [Gemmatimonadales bacterium]|nr:Holliday junction branch migration protein RuvA [Gemmatimonadales bacterium]